MNGSEFVPAYIGNSSFSAKQPMLQLAIDSTSLGEFKTCPRKYFYSIVMGFQPRVQSVHLTFGLLLHGGAERYQHGKSAGLSHADAMDLALDWTLRESWDKTKRRPWTPEDRAANVKNRFTLIRTLVAYLDAFGENDTLQTVQLANGKPAVELSFTFDSGHKAKATGEPIVFCGHLDRLALLNDVPYIVDIKTTGRLMTPDWFKSWSPGNQFSMYMLAGQVAYAVPVKGLIVDGARITVAASEFQRGQVSRTPDQLDEWLAGTHFWLDAMSDCATRGSWPMNDKSCDNFGGCQYRAVCSRPVGARQKWLELDFAQRIWNPLDRRGDV